VRQSGLHNLRERGGMGCGGSKDAGGSAGGGSGGDAKDQAAAEIQGAAAAYMKNKQVAELSKKQDAAAADIQASAAGYLAKKRAEEAKVESNAPAGDGIVGFISGIFSQRAAPAAAPEVKETAATPTAAAAAPAPATAEVKA